MDLEARIQLWRSIDPDPEFCRKAEREMLLLSSQDQGWVEARMREFDDAFGNCRRVTEPSAGPDVTAA